MKKIIFFSSFVLVIFVMLAIVTNLQNEKKVQGNPFGKESLNPATVQQLQDPIYQNIILPGELSQKLLLNEDVTVYFYSPTCPGCKQVSPLVVPLASEVGVDLKLFNILEFEQGWSEYGVTMTPTLIRFVNGVEESRIEGLATEPNYREWLTK